MIKHTLLWGLLLLGSTLSPSVYAQLSQGTRYWGGTVSFDGSDRNTTQLKNSRAQSNSSTFAVSPEVQWGRFSNATTLWGVGGGYTFSHYAYKNQDVNYLNESTTNSHAVTLLPFFRKYRLFNERWGLFLHTELRLGYGIYNRVSTVEDKEVVNPWDLGANVRPGAVYFFGKSNWALEGYLNVLNLGITYSHFKEQGQFRFISVAGTSFPSLVTLRVAKYL